ncbi:hypothetical protein [Endozoicomonas sp. Mp262]|uniref:hypothetical protein n=1 Tax=Endozoicomonas sp. Mp262 TaxID=2919499 RepID=UPI0021D88AA9
MKLWFAVMFCKDGYDEDAVYIVRAKSPVSCGEIVETNKDRLPDFINPFVTAAIEIGIDEYSETEAVLAGPFIGDGYFEQHSNNIYWRRDFPDDDWVNYTKFRDTGDYFDCIYRCLST